MSSHTQSDKTIEQILDENLNWDFTRQGGTLMRARAVTKQNAIAALTAREERIRVDELERLIPKPVAEMASIDYKAELERTYDEIRSRINEITSHGKDVNHE